ncbi:MarR family transcriptional regulator [Ramlibacter sp. G-1-2-2]|uniref:MarR family transcriptional regulator n=1 Tax=Ramlibacter agri TaxID=2728837 RepID=A0A848GXE6_9BURK|nr:MarR family transcriptional regulator [Ramlibacter agri]NML43336.1 MarR family transcriptional regulator [Ramlibacter agri]
MKAATKTRATPQRKAAAPAAAPRARVQKVPDADNWDARLGFLMHDVSRLRRSVFDEFMRPSGLTRSQWWILAHLSRHDGMIQSDLANMLDLGKAALGGLLDRLEASQQIERRADEADRRVKRIYLTGKGAQAIQEMRVKGHEVSERILEGLDLPARRTLLDNLALVKSNLLALRAEVQKTRGNGG